MKKLSTKYIRTGCFCIYAIIFILFSCKKDENPVKYATGIFPDSTIILSDLNSPYDDYNIDLYQLHDNLYIIFSSNRISEGGKFDLVQGIITYIFDQTTGEFGIGSEMTSDEFCSKLINSANTTGDDLGPYTLFSTVDGFEYMLLSSESGTGNLDFYYLKNRPASGLSLPPVLGPFAIKLLNTEADEAYICFDTNQDSAYFSSNYEGNFEIYMNTRPSETSLTSWFDEEYSLPVKVDSINSDGDDKCPYVMKKIMVFSSDREGGMGGYDIYYSLFNKGKWGSPVNIGPDINTPSNEYRPVIGFHEDFTNNFIIFSSDREGGKGRFDLYFRGITFPDK